MEFSDVAPSNISTSGVDLNSATATYYHVDVVNIAVVLSFALLESALIVYLRSVRAESNRPGRPTLGGRLQGHDLRSVVFIFACLTLLAEVGDALLSPRRLLHVLLTPVATLVTWLVGVVFFFLVESRRRPLLLVVSGVGWFVCGVARVWRLVVLAEIGFGGSHVRTWSTSVLAILFGVLALIDFYGVSKREVFATRHAQCDGKSGDTIVYRHNDVNFFSRATFFWLTSLLRVGYENPLELDDLGSLPRDEAAETVYQKFKIIYDEEKGSALRERRRVSLWRCYVKACWPMFILGGVFKLLGDFVGFIGPLGIPFIIDYVTSMQSKENYGELQLTLTEFIGNGYVMSVIILVSILAQGTLSQSSTNLVNVEGIHVKGALQALVYNKALRLCVWSIAEQKDEMESFDDTDEETLGMLKKSVDKKKLNKSPSNRSTSTSGTDVGTITNLVSEDAFNVMSFIWMGHYTWAIPLKIGVLMYLLYQRLGISAIIGAACCILIMTPLQFLIGKKMSSNSKAITEVSDERLRKVNEVLQGIKLLKLYGWESLYGSRISETRKKELLLLDKDSLYWALMTFLTQAASVLVTLVTFGTYFALGDTLKMKAGDVFAGLALFNQLTVPLCIFPITVPIVISALVSTRRLEDFLALPETSSPSKDDTDAKIIYSEEVEEKVMKKEVANIAETAPQTRDSRESVFGLGDIMENEEEPDEDVSEEDEDKQELAMMETQDGDVAISVEDGGFSWGGDDKISLSIPNMAIATGQLTLVVGKVGSGKTSLLSALLGEMYVASGKVHHKSDTSVAYAAQKPWLLNASLRDNILFGQPYRPRRYNRVVEACALKPDIDILPGKDFTEIGEKGINLSGGQKQRVSIARALYTQTSVVIMDDPLSALDYQVAQQVFEDGIKKLLLRQKRTVILVTHRLQLLSHAHKIIAMESGSVRAQGSLGDIEASDAELAKTWRVMMTREALEEKAKWRTARERWKLVKLVSRFGVQRNHKNRGGGGSWRSEVQLQTIQSQPSFVPFRKNVWSTFSGSRYFSHDLPLPTDECGDDFVMRPSRPSVKRRRPASVFGALGVSALPQHKQVLRTSSLQPRDNLPYPFLKQHSSPAMRLDPQSLAPCRTRNFTVDHDGSHDTLLRRILSLKTKRNIFAASHGAAPALAREPSVLKKFISPTSNQAVASPGKHEQFTAKRLMSTSSVMSDDLNDDDESDNSADVTAGRLVSEEEREYGKIPRRIYSVYLRACGVAVGLAYVFSTIVWHALRVFTDYWLKQWTESGNQSTATRTQSNTTDAHTRVEDYGLESAQYFFVVYAGLSVVSIILSLSSNGIGQYAGAQARRVLHEKMLVNILRCPIRFFEKTPVGRIINRFSTDMAVIDKKIATTIQRLLQFLLMCFSGVLLNAVVTPWFLLAAVPICGLYFFIQKFYRSSSRELQRLDSITRSPIFSHFSETLGGLTTIRAFSHQRRFTELLHKKMDAHTNVFLIINAGNRWIGIALDYLGGVIVFVAIIVSLWAAQSTATVTPALVGLAINYTLLVPIYLNWVVKYLADMEVYMSAVERVEQYALAEPEDYRALGVSVPLSWPEKGDIVFKEVSLRYDASHDPVVVNFNLHIPAGQKVGICGRSGSGKSSLAMSLFNMIDVFEGSIQIDDVDIRNVPLQVLRSRLSIIPQDVLMFGGTIRSNLDPRSQYTDDKLWMSLELAQLKDIVTSYPGGLDGEVREGGENLSAGERQLFCLARAILHDAACLVMDEATSSVDPATETALLAAASRAFASRTVITIAHRLPTILECDRILVLDGGRVVEDGSPTQLLNRSMGIFSSMLRASEEGVLAS